MSKPRIHLELRNGNVIVFSDCHYWPAPPTTTHRALTKFIKEIQPKILVCNGDAVDMASVSKHAPIGWESRPTVQEEIEAAQKRLHEIIRAAPKAKRTWNLGNHDARFESWISKNAPEFARVKGVHLKDHFPEWEPAWGTWINDDVVIKHRWKGGQHATWNNVVNSGKTCITGHLHKGEVRPYTDYNGTRYGVDVGCVADIYGPQFVNYTEDNPRCWRSAFCLLTFVKGKLLEPELVTRWSKNKVQFRGKLIRV